MDVHGAIAHNRRLNQPLSGRQRRLASLILILANCPKIAISVLEVISATIRSRLLLREVLVINWTAPGCQDLPGIGPVFLRTLIYPLASPLIGAVSRSVFSPPDYVRLAATTKIVGRQSGPSNSGAKTVPQRSLPQARGASRPL